MCLCGGWGDGECALSEEACEAISDYRNGNGDVNNVIFRVIIIIMIIIVIMMIMIIMTMIIVISSIIIIMISCSKVKNENKHVYHIF